MSRRVRDCIEVSQPQSLDRLINELESIRDRLPPDSGAELRMRGDEISGLRMTIAFSREQTAEEAEADTGFAGWLPADEDPMIELLRRQLDAVPFARRREGRQS